MIGKVFLPLIAAIFVASGAHAAPSDALADVRAWRAANEKRVLEEFSALLSLPNTSADAAGLQRNADHITRALSRRGFSIRLLRSPTGGPPAVFAERLTPGAKRTLLFYAHYDGQPVDQPGWRSAPFEPRVRSNPPAAPTDIDWRAAPRLDPDWRIYARAASDDKAPIQAMLSALDALSTGGARRRSTSRSSTTARRNSARPT